MYNNAVGGEGKPSAYALVYSRSHGNQRRAPLPAGLEEFVAKDNEKVKRQP